MKVSAGHGEKRSRREDLALAALISEPTIGEAAKKVGISEVTIWRWMQDPEFQDKYRTARRQAVSQAITQLQKISSEAVQTLREVMNNKETPPASRVTAAKAVLEMATVTVFSCLNVLKVGANVDFSFFCLIFGAV